MMEHRALNKARDSAVLIKIRATSVYHLKIHKTTYNHSLTSILLPLQNHTKDIINGINEK